MICVIILKMMQDMTTPTMDQDEDYNNIPDIRNRKDNNREDRVSYPNEVAILPDELNILKIGPSAPEQT